MLSCRLVVAQGNDRHIGRYEILARIGEGGMASVFLARQRGPQGFHKLVVIKRIHPNLARVRQFINMFLDEARIAAQINHHRVVQIFELGEDDGTYFIAMEYLEGESLATLLTAAAKRHDPPAPGVVARVVAQAADGLHAAHELRDLSGAPLEVVHRDVSPGNVLVLFDGSVKVVDFGVAKAQGRFTETTGGEIKGKFAYMSPEQLTDGDVDRRADIFALGIVLWESLAMRRLFRRKSHGATVAAVLGDRFAPPSAYRKGIWPALDDVAMRALERDPAARFQTADAMREALEDALHQSPTRVGATAVQATMEKFFGDRLRERRVFLERVAASETPIDSPDLFASDPRDDASDTLEALDTPTPPPTRDTLVSPPPIDPGLRRPAPSSSELDIAPYERPRRTRWIWLPAVAALLGAVWLAFGPREAPPVEVPPLAEAEPRPAPVADVPPPPPPPPPIAQPEPEPPKPQATPSKPRARHKPPHPVDKAQYGQLFLATIPRSTVYAGQKKVGETPLVGVRLPAGRHVLRLVRSDTHIDKTLAVDVVAGEDTRLVHRF